MLDLSVATFAVLTCCWGRAAGRARDALVGRSTGFARRRYSPIAALPGLWELGGLLRRLSNPERLATGGAEAPLQHRRPPGPRLGDRRDRTGPGDAARRVVAPCRWASTLGPSAVNRPRALGRQQSKRGTRYRSSSAPSPSSAHRGRTMQLAYTCRARGASLRTAGLLRPHPHRRGSGGASR